MITRYNMANHLNSTHWLAKQAIASPFAVIEDHYVERGYAYSGTLVFDAKTNILTATGNPRFHCPVLYYHHIGSVCPVCNNDERYILH